MVLPTLLLALGVLDGCAPATGPGERLASPPPPDAAAPPTTLPATPGGAVPPTPDGGLPAQPTECERLTINAERKIPAVMLVVDRSGSMRPSDGGRVGADRLTPSVAAVRSVVERMQQDIQFGLMRFPSDAECGTGRVDISPTLSASAAIGPLLSTTRAEGLTPTAASLRNVIGAFASVQGDRYVVLVTDGAPNCNGSSNGFTCRCLQPDPTACWLEPLHCLDDAEMTSAVQSLLTVGIKTFVLGYEVGAEAATVLDRAAAAGGTMRSTHIRVANQNELSQALAEITGEVVSCAYDLGTAPDDPAYVRVTIDGRTIPYMDSTGGWVLAGSTTVTLIGSACDRLRDGMTHAVTIVRECEPVIY
jgi:hypothetical protein